MQTQCLLLGNTVGGYCRKILNCIAQAQRAQDQQDQRGLFTRVGDGVAALAS